MTDITDTEIIERLRLCEQVRPYAEQLRGMAGAALRGAGQDWRGANLQVAFIVGIIADAVEDDRSRRK